MRPEKDQLPGSCKNWLPVGSWIDISNATAGCTWVSLDAPLVELGEVSANMLGSQTEPNAWRRTIEPTQTIYSWVMNNHWETNYRAYQQGPVEFRYAIRLHHGEEASAIDRFGVECAQPLLIQTASAASRAPAAAPLFHIEPAGTHLTSLKPSDDGAAWIVRLLRFDPGNANLSLRWNRPVGQIWISNTAEERVAPFHSGYSMAQAELLTLRVERR